MSFLVVDLSFGDTNLKQAFNQIPEIVECYAQYSFDRVVIQGPGKPVCPLSQALLAGLLDSGIEHGANRARAAGFSDFEKERLSLFDDFPHEKVDFQNKRFEGEASPCLSRLIYGDNNAATVQVDLYR